MNSAVSVLCKSGYIEDISSMQGVLKKVYARDVVVLVGADCLIDCIGTVESLVYLRDVFNVGGG